MLISGARGEFTVRVDGRTVAQKWAMTSPT